MREVWLWWSSGKDSAWALETLRRSGEHEVTRLVTTTRPVAGADGTENRVAMHDVRRDLLEAQARALGLPLHCVDLPFPASNRVYEAAAAAVFAEAKTRGVSAMAFGDLFLEDIRNYRAGLLEPTGLDALFPLWQCETRELAEEMLAAGLRAEVVCVDLGVLDASFAGIAFDAAFLKRLPKGIDPCGENGEFHTFVTDGPMFASPLSTRRGAVEVRDGFAFADLYLDNAQTP